MMQTPAGVECRFYYQDFHRGRSLQECRLIQNNPASQSWRPKLCETCPVPAILRANACPNMTLTAWVGRRWLLFRQVKIKAYCSYVKETVAEPMIGCGHCHEGKVFSVKRTEP